LVLNGGGKFNGFNLGGNIIGGNIFSKLNGGNLFIEVKKVVINLVEFFNWNI
jgi:hypothetical protein